MNTNSSQSALMFLGRRIERLLYVGVFLLILCFVELYLVSASVHFASEGEVSIGSLLIRIEAEKGRLSSLYRAQQSPREKTLLAERDRYVAETRSKLGLPPELVSDSREVIETYRSALSALVSDVAQRTHIRSDALEALLDISKPPEENIEILRGRLRDLEKKTARIWGIETPRLISIQYGGSDYRIPASFLATSLLFVLAPLLLGWLGSLYLTRQRELLAISKLDDYKLTFPHILNLMPIAFVRLERRLGMEQTQKSGRIEKALKRYIWSSFRSLLILVFTAPMVFVVIYSVFQLLVQFDSYSILYAGTALIFGFVLAIQSISLVAQEWVVLHKVEFYE